MKITLINQYTGPLFIDVVNSFANQHHVVLITGSISEGNTKLNTNVHVKKLIRYRRNSSLGRLCTWLFFTIQSFFYLIRSHSDHIFIVSNPPFTNFLGPFFLKFLKTPYSLLIYDLYPDVLGQLGYLKKNGWLYKLWSRVNFRIYKYATYIFTISEHMAMGIKQYLRQDCKDIFIVPPWSDNEFIKPVDKLTNPFISAHGLENKLVILYSGNMGITHDLESVIKSAEGLKMEKQIQFLMIGDGAKRAGLEQMVIKSKLDNVLFLPFQTVDVLPFSLSCGDIAVITLGKGAEWLSVPSKTYAMLAAGCALLIIASEDSEIAHLVKNYECGEVFEPGNVVGITGFIKTLHMNQSLLKKYKTNARKASYHFTSANTKKITDHFNPLLL